MGNLDLAIGLVAVLALHLIALFGALFFTKME